MLYTFPVEANSAIALFSDSHKFDAFRPQLQVGEQGVELLGTPMAGHEVFALAKSDVQYVMFDLDAAALAKQERPCTVPMEQLHPFALGIQLEMQLAEIVQASTERRAAPRPAIDAFMAINFFCFDSSTDMNVVNPVADREGGDSFVLLYTSSELRGLAEAPLRERNAFVGLTITYTRVPAAAVLQSLTAAGAQHAGLSINAAVPDLSPAYAANKLRTTALVQAVSPTDPTAGDSVGQVV